MLLARICQELRRPLFEVKMFPESELEWWSVIFSIRDNKDTVKLEPDEITVEDSKAKFKKLWG